MEARAGMPRVLITNSQLQIYAFFLAAFFFGAAAVAAFVTFFAGLDLPNDPLAIFPFLVLMSPRHMITDILMDE